jgi:hypothetical protein
MGKKIHSPRWQPKPLWTARRLEELSMEVERLRKKVRVAESAIIKASSRKGSKTSLVSTSRH